MQKKGKILLSAVLAAVMVFAFGAVALAAPADSDTSEAKIEFTAGNLELNAVPALNFGTHAIDNTTVDFATPTGPSTMQVADARGSGAGWKVTAQLGAFTVTGGTTPIGSATITLTSGTAAGVGTSDTAPVVKTPVTLATSGAADTVATAAVNSGRGTWNVSWTAPNASINVPVQHQQIGEHTAILSWTLEDAP
ncbi:MAG: WxL domain-containing protein [Christensenella sp.]|uniref:WxL domain-containing protein n=1 Tax=Christensenella sp. TaxID=1935934 RepID=UPI002B214C20|nr:WxL domain-containing protein [Christensenella sp.]MEA5001901.1 WxL domain-containing protein [Christensenella sp.]